jgi:hypothetical protein
MMKRAHSARRGITILEVLIVVTGVALMLGLCAVSIQLLMRLNSDGMSRVGAAVALERLGRQLRNDVHASQTAEVASEGKPASLRLVFASSHIVSYESSASRVVRTETTGGNVARHESFSLPNGTTARFELREVASRRLVALVTSRSATTNQVEPPRPLDLVACVGKDHLGAHEKMGGKAN